jgi:hypothetical protein
VRRPVPDPEQLSRKYLAGLEAVAASGQPDAESLLKELQRFLAGWYGRPGDWSSLWEFTTMPAPHDPRRDTGGTATGDPPPGSPAAHLRREQELLDRLAGATRVGDSAVLSIKLQILVRGAGVMAAQDGGDRAARTLPTLLKAIRQPSRRALTDGLTPAQPPVRRGRAGGDDQR